MRLETVLWNTVIMCPEKEGSIYKDHRKGMSCNIQVNNQYGVSTVAKK